NVITGISPASIVFGFTGGVSTGTFGTPVEVGNGVYTVQLTGVLAGSASNVSVTVGGTPITQTQAVTVQPRAVNAGTSTLTLSSATLDLNTSETVMPSAKDAGGNVITGISPASIVFTFTGGTSAGTFGTPVEVGNGVYTVQLTGTTSGTASTVSVTVGGTP